METKNLDNFVLNELCDLNFDSHFLVPPPPPPPHGHGGGGLALFRNNHIEIKIISSSHNYLDTITKVKGQEFNCTFTYGAQGVWDTLATFLTMRPGPWLLTSDFKEIIENAEKVGGPHRYENSFVPFKSFLSHGDLFDLQHTGNFLSWRGKRNKHVV